MFGPKSRSTRGYGLRDTADVGGHDVGITFDNNRALRLSDRTFRKVEPVKHFILVIHGSFWGVEVFGALVVVKQFASPEPNHTPGDVPDGPHETTSETVIVTAPSRNGKATFFDVLNSETAPT